MEERSLKPFFKGRVTHHSKSPTRRIWRFIPIVVLFVLLLTSFEVVAWDDDMESGDNGWRHYWISGASVPDNWAISTSRWHTPIHSWYSGAEVANWVNGGDTALESPPMEIKNASESYIDFWHWYEFDYLMGNYADGGIVEIDDGSGWQQIFPMGGYDGVIAMGNLNPLEGLQAFVGASSTWQYVSFNISAYAGKVVRIRFHIGWDWGTIGIKEGWYIDDIEMTNSTFPQHEIIIKGPNVPTRVEPNIHVPIGGSVRNRGKSDEMNVTVNLTVDGLLVNEMTIDSLQNRAVAQVELLWKPIMERTYNVCLEATPVSGEMFIDNNKNCVNVEARAYKGSILLDQTHDTDNSSDYLRLLESLSNEDYKIEYQYKHPIASSDLLGHNVFVVPQARLNYSSSELVAIRDFVHAGNGLFVIGDDSPSVYTNLTSFAGISWTKGGISGTTNNITGHQITTGITTVDMGNPESEMIPSGSAISLVRDSGGGHALTVSTNPGRVAGFSDEDSFRHGMISSFDNKQLALNIIDWLQGLDYERDVAIIRFDAPKIVDLGTAFNVDAIISNTGRYNETNLEVDFEVDSVLESNLTITFLAVGDAEYVSFSYSSAAEGFYKVGISVHPVQNESFTGNNRVNQTVRIGHSVYVGIYDHADTSDVSYFEGANGNYYGTFQTILDTDPMSRFRTTIVTDLSSHTLSSFDVILLPDNAVPNYHLTDVEGFFAGGRGIVGVDSAISYMAYSGFLWPSAIGTNGYGTYWDSYSLTGDQEILTSHDISTDYILGGLYSSNPGEARMFVRTLPLDALVLTRSALTSNQAYVVAREVLGSGRIVELGPFAESSLPTDLLELVRDAVYWAGNTISDDHDMAVSYLHHPYHIRPGDEVTVDTVIRNIGSTNETDIEVNFTVDGNLVDQKNIPFVSSEQTKNTTFRWVPAIEKTYSICVEVTPLLNENITSNNDVCRKVGVKTVKAFILFDQTHNSRSITSFSSLKDMLASLGYVIDTLVNSPITSSALSEYDILILLGPSTAYTAAELSAIQSFVSSGHGLLLMGVESSTMYTDITSFAGIEWSFGAFSGETFDITSHYVTTGVNSVYLPSPSLNLIPLSPAISLVRDVAGSQVLAVSGSPGRVAAFTDESAFDNPHLSLSDNSILAINLIEWLNGRGFEHDLMISNLSVESPLERWVTHQVHAQVQNLGSNDENGITVRLLFDGVPLDTKVISFLAVNTTELVTFNLTPSSTGFHDVGMEVVPFPGENETGNNYIEKRVMVQDTSAPDAPTNLTVSNTLDPTALELRWSPNTEQDLSHYTVYMSVDGTNYFFESNVPAAFRKYTDTGLLQGLTYYYQITASDDIPNESPRSSPAVGIPGTDYDSDGIIDIFDPDDDNDGVPDIEDDFPFDQTEWKDSDGDGIGDNADSDDDNDGVPDVDDDFPKDPTEWEDTDGDGLGDNIDPDDDNDGYSDIIEEQAGSDPKDPFSVPLDIDGDGIIDPFDPDIDGDGAPNENDAFPYDPYEWEDTDGDGIGDNADSDDDNDGVPDVDDDFPDDPTEWEDTDGDGLGDNVDPDDDNDGYSDIIEEQAGSDPKDPFSVPLDTDGDGIIDLYDEDDDGDDVYDGQDVFPLDPTEWQDTDNDGTGDNADPDDDSDGIPDVSDPDPLIPNHKPDTEVVIDYDRLQAATLLIIALLALLLLTLMVSVLLFLKMRRADAPSEEEYEKEE
jgi:hypothetical protein